MPIYIKNWLDISILWQSVSYLYSVPRFALDNIFRHVWIIASPVGAYYPIIFMILMSKNFGVVQKSVFIELYIKEGIISLLLIFNIESNFNWISVEIYFF